MGVPAVDLKDVPRRLVELVEEASREGEILLTQEGEAVARIIPAPARPRTTAAGERGRADPHGG